MAPEPSPGRALALTAAGAGVLAAGAGLCWWLVPDRPAWMALPVLAGAGCFLLGVRRFVKPPRTGAEER